MNWISRYNVRIGSALAIIALAFLSVVSPARADSSLAFVYQNQDIKLTHVSSRNGMTMVGVADPGFRALVKAVGAVMTWNPGERYVLITTAEPQVISFAVDDTRYDVGPVSSQAPVAPYVDGNEVYVPLDPLLRALYLAPKRDGAITILQPQLASIDVRGSGNQAELVAHAGSPLRARVVSDAGDRVVYEFDGVGSTLERSRTVDAGGIVSFDIATAGSVRDPKTLVTVVLAANAHHDAGHSNNGDDFQVGFTGPSITALPATGAPVAQVPMPRAPLAQPVMPRTTVAEQTLVPGPSAEPAQAEPSGTPVLPTPIPAPNAAAGTGTVAATPAQVTAVIVQQSGDGTSVSVAVNGSATYEWHRLRAPDNRFWIDLDNAQLAMAPLEQAEADPLLSVRVRQENPTTVRVALSLSGQNDLTVSSSANGLAIVVAKNEVADAIREGAGSVGAAVATDAQGAPLVTPAPSDNEQISTDDGWKFGPRNGYVPANPKLIVIDPGHGGSDPGSARNGTEEKTVNLDMAMRLRDILVARGWQVQMTRTADVDVYAPNDSAHTELQARDNVANNAGARLFVSIHANAFINSGPSGVTVYCSKPSDLPFAEIEDRELGQDLGVKDDGVIKSHMYVTLHALMPAVLIETAFLSNPSDYAKLTSPAWRQKVAEAIADGIDRYAQSYPVSGTGAQ